MPTTLTPDTSLQDILLALTVPLDSEDIDAADVNVPFQTLLNGMNLLYQRQNRIYAQQQQVAQAQPSLQVLSSVTSLNLEPARTYTFTKTIRVNRFGGLTGRATLVALNAPAGVQISFVPNPANADAGDLTVDSTADLVVTTSAQTVAGNYDLLVRGELGGAVADIDIPLYVAAATAAPSFTITGPAAVAIDRSAGASATASVNLQRAGGFSDAVAFTADVPTGITATYSSAQVTGNDSITREATVLTLTAGPTVPIGTFSATIRAVSGSTVRTLAVAVTVSAPAPVAGTPDYSLTVEYDSGDAWTSNGATIHINRAGGFVGPVRLSTSGVDPDGPVVVINGLLGAVTVTGTAARLTVDGISRGWTASGIAPQQPPEYVTVTNAQGDDHDIVVTGNWQQVLLNAVATDGTLAHYTQVDLRRGNRRVG